MAGGCGCRVELQAEIDDDCLPDQQAGFGAGRAVRDQSLVFHIPSQKLLAGGEGACAVAVFLDRSAAFSLPGGTPHP